MANSCRSCRLAILRLRVASTRSATPIQAFLKPQQLAACPRSATFSTIPSLQQPQLRKPKASVSAIIHRAFASQKTKPPSTSQKPKPRTRQTQPSTTTTPSPSRTPPSAPSTSQPIAQYIPTGSVYTHTLSTRPSATILFESPASNAYPLGCLAFGSFCIGAGIFYLYDALLIPHPGLHAVVLYCWGVIGIFCLFLGSWAGLGARRLVGRLAVAGPGVARKEFGELPLLRKSAGRPGELLLQIEKKTWFPWARPAVLVVDAGEVRIGNRVATATHTAAGRGAAEAVGAAGGGTAPTLSTLAAEASARGREVEVGRKSTGGLLAPLWGLYARLAAVLRRGLGREGFLTLWVDGVPWKMDVQKGWCLDEGIAIDRLFKLR